MKSPHLLDSIKRNGLDALEKITPLFRANVFEVLEVIQGYQVANVSEIQAEMDDIGQPQTSMALRDLRRAGLVHRHRVGKEMYYNVIPGAIGRLNRICADLAEGYDASVNVMEHLETV